MPRFAQMSAVKNLSLMFCHVRPVATAMTGKTLHIATTPWCYCLQPHSQCRHTWCIDPLHVCQHGSSVAWFSEQKSIFSLLCSKEVIVWSAGWVQGPSSSSIDFFGLFTARNCSLILWVSCVSGHSPCLSILSRCKVNTQVLAVLWSCRCRNYNYIDLQMIQQGEWTQELVWCSVRHLL